MKNTSTTRPGSPVRFLVLCLLLVLIVLAVAGCTRDRPAPEQVTPTPSAAVESTPVPPTTGPTQPGGEPDVELAPQDASGALTGTVGAGSTEPTIQNYEVQPGDTLLSIALEYNVSADRLREINFLQSDMIQAGQILQVPMLPPTPVPTPEPFTHVVQAGESLGTIAQLYGVSWADLTLINQLEDANALQVGMTLIIPGVAPEAGGEGDAESADGEAAPASANGNAIHRVRAGETLSQIAQMYGVTTSQIVTTNNLTSRNIIKPGQELVIPGVSPLDAERARSVRHTVAVGESLSQIAKEYGVEVGAIVRANGLPNPDSVYVGQQLVIPVSEE